MQYKRTGNKIVARMDKGEEILTALRDLCEREKVTLASVSAIGAINEFVVGAFDTVTKVYRSNEFRGIWEIVSLTGNVTTKDGAHYSHIHMSAADENGEVRGGHLNRAVISATCEMIVDVIEGRAERTFSDEIGLNLLDFDK